MGKRIYLGDNTQVSRLFGLLASRIGRSQTLAEVQRAVDLPESSLEVGTEEGEIRKSHQRVGKATLQVRAALLEASVDSSLSSRESYLDLGDMLRTPTHHVTMSVNT